MSDEASSHNYFLKSALKNNNSSKQKSKSISTTWATQSDNKKNVDNGNSSRFMRRGVSKDYKLNEIKSDSQMINNYHFLKILMMHQLITH